MPIVFLAGKWLCTYKLKPLYTACLHSIKRSRYSMEIKFNDNPLTV